MDLHRLSAEVAGNCLCFNLRKATRLLTQSYDAALKPSGLRVTQFSVLVAINLGGPRPMQSLAELLGMERTTLTRNLRGLQEGGFVVSSPGEDRRSRLIALTDAGRDALERALPLWRAAQDSAVDALQGATVPVLIPILNRISEMSKAAVAVAGSISSSDERGA